MSKKSGIFAGIDFGNSNSCIAIYKYEKVEVLAGADGSRITPSYVYIGENGEKHVGKSAKNYGHKKPERLFYDIKRLFAAKTSDQICKKYKNQWTFDIKRDTETGYCNYNIDGKIYTPEEISSEVLKKLLSYVGEDVAGVVLTVPAFFSTEQKNKILEAAEMAGITVLQLICEPTAAAIAYGMEHSYTNGEVLFVFDIGDESFDISIIKVVNNTNFEVIVLGGDSHLGGRDFDGVIIDWMLKKLEEKVGKNNLKKLTPIKKFLMTEMAKEAIVVLNNNESATLQLSEVHSDASDVTLTRTEFEELSKGLVLQIKESIVQILKCRALNQQEINHVLLIGGSSKIPIITKLLKEFFDEAKFSKSCNAEELVAMGATRLAAKLGKQSTRSDITDLVYKDKISLNVGIEYADKNGESMFKTIFKKDTPYNQEQVIEMKTTQDNQKECEIALYEGLYDELEKNTHIGSLKLINLPPKKAGEYSVDVILTIDKNGILEVKTNDLNCAVQYKTQLLQKRKT
uniref:Heat shock protein 70 n=1 Tax=Panagrolaimus davidi TaxID=227884 RepID=A0A914QFQ3_9BILA